MEDFFIKDGMNSIFVITYQIINEVSNILLKNAYTETEVKESIEYMFKVCTIQDFTKDIILLASSMREKYALSFWDSIIVGSALFSGCNILASEDMQDGLIVNNALLIKNVVRN